MTFVTVTATQFVMTVGSGGVGGCGLSGKYASAFVKPYSPMSSAHSSAFSTLNRICRSFGRQGSPTNSGGHPSKSIALIDSQPTKQSGPKYSMNSGIVSFSSSLHQANASSRMTQRADPKVTLVSEVQL